MAPTTATGSRTTRSKTGNSKPRIFAEVEAPAIPTKKRSTKKKTTTKANTSKPRSKKTATGRVAKPKTTTSTTTKKAPAKKEKTVKAKAESKINGAVEKLEGAVEGKPAKKVGTRDASISTEKAATFQAGASDFTVASAPAAAPATTADPVRSATSDAMLIRSPVHEAPAATADFGAPAFAFGSCTRAWRRMLLPTPGFPFNDRI